MAEESKLPPQNEPEKRAPGAEPAFDAASQSLTNALRTSFRVLTLVILVLIVLFLSRGFFNVQSDQKVVILRFGKTDANLVKGQGWHYALPYPIDEVVPVWVRTKTLDVNTFWPKVSDQSKQNAAEKGAKSGDVFEGADDGRILTGDMNILQARWEVTYSIRGGNEAEPRAILSYFGNVGDEQNEKALIRGLLESAIVTEFAAEPVNDIYPKGNVAISERVLNRMHDAVEKLDIGLSIRSLNVMVIQPGGDVKAAFDNVLSARQTAAQAETDAEREARKMLIDAGGEVGVDLGKAIDCWWQARAKGDDAATKAARDQMSELFTRAKGQSVSILNDAQTYRATVVSEAKADRDRLQSLVEKNSPKDVQLFLEHMRVDAIQTVLNNCYEKFLFNPNQKEDSTLELWINRRTEILREARKIQEK